MLANNAYGLYLGSIPIYKLYIGNKLIYSAITHWKSDRVFTEANIVLLGEDLFIPKNRTSNPPFTLYTDVSGNYLTYKDGGYVMTDFFSYTDKEGNHLTLKDGSHITNKNFNTEYIKIN